MAEKIIVFYEGTLGPGIFFAEEKSDLTKLLSNTQFRDIEKIFLVESPLSYEQLYENFKKILPPEITERNSNEKAFTKGNWKYVNYKDSYKNPHLLTFFEEYFKSFKNAEWIGKTEFLFKKYLLRQKKILGEYD